MSARWRQTGIIVLFAVAAAVLGAWIASQRYAAEPAAEDAVQVLWSLQLPAPDGTPVPLERFRGQVLVVNFWATWCPPCVQEMPELSRIRDEYASNGAEIIGIGVDNASSIAAFSQRTPVSYPLLVAGMQGSELSRRFGNANGVLPFTVVLDRSGRIVDQRIGIVEFDRLREQLRTLTAAPAS